MSNFLLINSHPRFLIIPRVRVNDILDVINTKFFERLFVFTYPANINYKSTYKFNQSPRSIKLIQNYLNPYNSETIFQNKLSKISFIILKIFNILRQEKTILIK